MPNTDSIQDHFLSIIFKIYPTNWYIAYVGNSPAGIVAAFDYGTCAYVGCMCVLPEYQKQNLGTILMNKVLEPCKNKEVLLDASDVGYPLYKKFGFEEIDKAYIFVLDKLENIPKNLEQYSIQSLDQKFYEQIFDFDNKVLRRNRKKLLTDRFEKFKDRSFVALDSQQEVVGYIVARQASIGPFLAKDSSVALELLNKISTLSFLGEPTIIFPESNQEAKVVYEKIGTLRKHCTHMILRKKTGHLNRDQIWGQFTYATG